MTFFQDPIILTFLALLLISTVVLLRPRHRQEMWLVVLTVLLFGLPRAGLFLQRVNLPLPLVNILVALFVAEWLILRGRRYHEQSRINTFFLLYAAVAGLGLAIGLTTGGNHTIAFMELCFYLFSMGLFFYASETFCEQRHFLLFARLILLVSVIVSIYGMAQKYLGTAVLVDRVTHNAAQETSLQYLRADVPFRRVLSSYGDPNVLASQLIVFVGISLAIFVGKKVPRRMRMVGGVVLAVNVLCLLCTRSRTGFISLALVSILVLCWRTRWALLVLPIIGVLAVMVVPEFLAARFASRFGGLVSGTDIRAQFPAMVWQLLQAAPMGGGLGNSVLLDLQGASWSFRVIPAPVIWAGFNSFWLNLFSRLGIPGVVCFALLLGSLFRYIWRGAKQTPNPEIKAILIGGLAGLVGQCVIWLANNTYMLPGGNLNFWFIMGMLVAGCRAFRAPQEQAAMLTPEGAWPVGYPLPAWGRA